MAAQLPLETRIVRSFDRYGQQSTPPLLKVLRRRLFGELFGDADTVTATLDPAFEVVMHVGDSSVTLPGTAIAEGVRVQAAAGMLMWTEFDDLVVGGDLIAASGSMLNLDMTDASLRTTPVGLFLRFSGDLMVSEVAFMGASSVADVSAAGMPSVEALRAQLSA